MVEKIPRQLAEKYEMLAVNEKDGLLNLVLNDPMNFYGIEDIRQITGMQLNISLSPRAELLRAIHYYYSEVGAKKAARVANESIRRRAVGGAGDQ